MKIEIQPADKMSQSGSGILRVLQNQSLPDLDFLVREVIQNSLDAAVLGATYVSVDFSMGTFNENLLDVVLEGFDVKKIHSRFDRSYIVITDRNTNGLTGPLKHEDIGEDQEYGNLIPLVYDLAKPQEQEGAGGSWGYGKSMYYRLGAGLVFYYTQIIEDGVVAERLVAAYVEDEKGKDTLLPPAPGTAVKTGIAWWGEKVGENKTIPITNSNKILEILNVFGIDRFKANETGTKIIIPFLDEKSLLRRSYGYDESKNSNLYYGDDLLDYISTSVQRWYAPRLYNDHYSFNEGVQLKVTINDIWNYEFETIFEVFQDMYNYAVTKNDKHISDKKYKNSNIEISEVQYYKTRNYFKSPYILGTLVHAKFKYSDLGMQNPNDNNYPHFLVGLTRDLETENQDYSNRPLVTYVRQPGMLINYEDSSKWTADIPPTGLDEYVIAIFVLESNAIVYDDTSVYARLDEYVRQGEKADHISWSDPILRTNDKQYDLVDVLKRKVNGSLKSKYATKHEEASGKSQASSLMSKVFTDKLLPTEGYGTKASKKRTQTRVSTGQIYSTKKHRVHILDGEIIYEPNRITIPFKIEKLKNFDMIEIEVKLQGSKDHNIPKLEGEQNQKVRLDIESVSIDEINNDTQYSATTFGTVYKAMLSTEDNLEVNTFNGRIVMHTTDPRIIPVISISVRGDDYE